MKTSEFLGLAGLIGLGVYVVRKLSRKKKKEVKEEKQILGTFKYPVDFTEIIVSENIPDSITVDHRLVYYTGMEPDLSNLSEDRAELAKSMINLERKAEEFKIILNNKVKFKPDSIIIEKINEDYRVIVSNRVDIISGYLIKEV